MDTLYAPCSVYIKECDPEFPSLLSTERIIYSCLGPHPRILECLNGNIYSLPVETRYEVAKSEPLRFTIAPNGDLMRYLLARRMSPPLRAKWGLQIAEDVWGDCSTANMLLTADLDILLCDFGGSALYGGRTNILPPCVTAIPPSRTKTTSTTGTKSTYSALGIQGRSLNSQGLLIDDVFFPLQGHSGELLGWEVRGWQRNKCQCRVWMTGKSIITYDTDVEERHN
ncbi:hypothetical protein B0H14DRAFT_3165252 [Mycena olivaceomarginata]|nr:hypothetical protein B0H14DRAFT_3165252 [Mycena olivaceomarginata]